MIYIPVAVTTLLISCATLLHFLITNQDNSRRISILLIYLGFAIIGHGLIQNYREADKRTRALTILYLITFVSIMTFHFFKVTENLEHIKEFRRMYLWILSSITILYLIKFSIRAKEEKIFQTFKSQSKNQDFYKHHHVYTWYKHPSSIKNANFNIFIWLSLAYFTFNILLTKSYEVPISKQARFPDANMYRFILLITTLPPFLLMNIYKKIQFNFKYPHYPLVRLDSIGIDVAAKKKYLFFPNKDITFAARKLNFHLHWEEISYLHHTFMIIPRTYIEIFMLRFILSNKKIIHLFAEKTHSFIDSYFYMMQEIAYIASHIKRNENPPFPCFQQKPIKILPLAWLILIANIFYLSFCLINSALFVNNIIASPLPIYYPFAFLINLMILMLPYRWQAIEYDEALLK